jgi:hypothetical protein
VVGWHRFASLFLYGIIAESLGIVSAQSKRQTEDSKPYRSKKTRELTRELIYARFFRIAESIGFIDQHKRIKGGGRTPTTCQRNTVLPVKVFVAPAT